MLPRIERGGPFKPRPFEDFLPGIMIWCPRIGNDLDRGGRRGRACNTGPGTVFPFDRRPCQWHAGRLSATSQFFDRPASIPRSGAVRPAPTITMGRRAPPAAARPRKYRVGSSPSSPSVIEIVYFAFRPESPISEPDWPVQRPPPSSKPQRGCAFRLARPKARGPAPADLACHSPRRILDDQMSWHAPGFPGRPPMIASEPGSSGIETARWFAGAPHRSPPEQFDVPCGQLANVGRPSHRRERPLSSGRTKS